MSRIVRFFEVHAQVQALIARRKEATVVEADDPSLFGELDKAEAEAEAAHRKPKRFGF